MKVMEMVGSEKQALPQYPPQHRHENVASSGLVAWEPPRQLSLRAIITTACNHRCSFCFREERPIENGFSGEFSKELLQSAAREAAKHHITQLRLTGGEPLLRADILDLVSSIMSAVPIKVGLTTNGVLLKDMAQDLFNVGLRSVNVSVPAITRTMYEIITGRDNLDIVLGGIDKALQTGLALKINVPIVKRNTGEIGSILEYFLRLPDVAIRLFSILEYPDVSHQDYVPESEIYAAVVEWCRTANIRQHEGQPRIFVRPHRKVNGTVCNSCVHKTRCAENAVAIRLTPDGYLKPCLLNNNLAVNFASMEPEAFEKAYSIAMNLYNGS
ncbi:GTP 3',8-cyclase MoaA [Planctomycetales bacterium]|nr:GTP 3',8-cyclase MoaA [Planctomycetales bacterium]GHT38025.1 GTP 3',8-cyclase MoaA [Planctomycetales bacterium]